MYHEEGEKCTMWKNDTLYGIYKRCQCVCRCKEQTPKNWSVHLLLRVQGACQPKNSQNLQFGKLQERFLKCWKGFRKAGKVLEMQKRF